ncbi:hypothetical protein GCM10018783_56140 [Streptomyces griseosporeus]|nr:hypothetical protein GCM10018783_56140 [Streptomyces griseosporeus]
MTPRVAEAPSLPVERSAPSPWVSLTHRWSLVPAHRMSPARRRFSPLLAARERWRTHPDPSAARGRRGFPGPVPVSPARTPAAPHRTPVPTAPTPPPGRYAS